MDTAKALIVHTFRNTTIQQRASDGYVDATAMCQAVDKKLNDYSRLSSTKAFLKELSMSTGIPVDILVDRILTGRNETRGTWVHPKIAINLGQWCSPRFAVFVSDLVLAWAENRFVDSSSHAYTQPQIQQPTLKDVLDVEAALVRLGQFGDRDRLMIADGLRTVMSRQLGVGTLGTGQLQIGQHGFDVADAITAVAPNLTTKQMRSLTPTLGKRIAVEYRERYGKEPMKQTRYVDGKNRQVNWYAPEHADWVYPIIQSFIVGLLPSSMLE